MCRALAIPTKPVFASNANVMVNMDEDGKVSIERDVNLQVANADHVVMVILQFMEGAWPRSSESLENVPDFDLRMAKSRRAALFPFPHGVVD